MNRTLVSKISAALQSAADALQPPTVLYDDFVWHWKSLTRYYVDSKDNRKLADQTNIPAHLEQMLQILTQEMEELEDQEIKPDGPDNVDHVDGKVDNDLSVSKPQHLGPCINYLLTHKILETLHTLARTDCPPGMKSAVLVFYTKFISKLPFVWHSNVYRPLQNMVRLCGEVRAGPSESEEIALLFVLAGKLNQHPEYINHFITKVNPVGESTETPSCRLVSAVLQLSRSPDSRIAVKACEVLMVVCTIQSAELAAFIGEHSGLTRLFCDRLVALYRALPTDLLVDTIECTDARWGLDITDVGPSIHGHRQLISFLSWLDYLDQLIKASQGVIGKSLVFGIRESFIQPIVAPLLKQISESGALLATVFVKQCLLHISSSILVAEFVGFILGLPLSDAVGSPEVRQLVIQRCDHMSDELSIAALKMFQVLFQKHCECVSYNLILFYLKDRSYIHREAVEELSESDESGTDSDRSDQLTSTELNVKMARHKRRSASLLRLQNPNEELEAPPLADVINAFITILPDNIKSSGSHGYEDYLKDSIKTCRSSLIQCVRYDWPGFLLPLRSCANLPFDEGPFLNGLFNKLERLLDQSYSVNLQLLQLLSQLAHLPHPHLHEYLLNPFIRLPPGARSLYSILVRLSNDLLTRCQRIPDHRTALALVRSRLETPPGNAALPVVDSRFIFLFEGAVLLEEFCKELAAIVYVKENSATGNVNLVSPTRRI